MNDTTLPNPTLNKPDKGGLADMFKRLFGLAPPDGSKPMTEEEYEDVYREPASFAQYLPFKDYDKESEVFLLDDGLNVGVVLELAPVDIEGLAGDKMFQPL